MAPVNSMTAPASSHLVRPSRSLQRSLSTESGEPESSLVDRRSFRSLFSRPATYRSGTQSECTSRDASPDKGKHPRRITPYPAAPPSMIITPSHTPRREQSVERQPSHLTSDNMRELYHRLSAIDRTDSPEALADAAIANERKGSVRLLTKSLSVDSGEDPPGLPPDAGYRYMSATDEYSDAPLSRTLPASVRFGGLVMTPGVESLTRTMRSQEQLASKPDTKARSESLSPRSARRKFFEDFATGGSSSQLPPSAYMSWPERRSRRGDFEKKAKADNPRESEAGVSGRMVSQSPERREDRSSSATKKSFFQAVKDKRKLFGAKRSTSVDSSAVHSSIARIGMQVLPPAAPPSIDLPTVPVVEPARSRRSLFKSQRAGSVDTTTLLSTTPKSSASSLSSVTVTRLEPREQHLQTVSTSATSPVTTSASATSSKPPDGTSGSVKETNDDHSTPAPTLTPKFPRPQTPPHRRPPTRWRRSMVKASDNPIPIQDSTPPGGTPSEKPRTKNTSETSSDKKITKPKVGKPSKVQKSSSKKSEFAELVTHKKDTIQTPSNWNFSETSV